MEKQLFIFNARCGALESGTESFICEPFFSTGLKQGDELVLDVDFVILNEVAFPCSGKDEKLVDWLTSKISGFKREKEISADSKRSACEILAYIDQFKRRS